MRKKLCVLIKSGKKENCTVIKLFNILEYLGRK